jgi:hypothetical protein
MLYDAVSISSLQRVAIPPGIGYCVDSPPANALVTPELAAEVRRALERFSRDAGYSADRPVGIFFKPGTVGHHKSGRAADIYGVGGSGLDIWKKRWTDAMARAAQAGDLEARHGIEREERRRNLGWRLYKALQLHGRWAQPYGYPIQLFGPWTRSEGPWSFISDSLLHAHRDHIHVAK